MGLFRFFRWPIFVNDELFGRLRYITFKDPTLNYFEGKGHFEPTNSQIEYLINADKKGPTREQKEFYQKLQVGFKTFIAEKIKPLIEAEFGKWNEDFVIQDFSAEFELLCITIPCFNTRPLEWEISFMTRYHERHYVMIDFVDHKPNEIFIHG